MANGKKTFYIEINGIQESVSAVDSLNKQLDALEKRIDTLKSKNINISASGGGNTKALDEEAKLLQQIEQLHQKVRDTEKEEYQELLNAKQELKEYQTIAKSIAAQENLKSGINDTSTMMGAKAQLRDLKAAMQTVDMNGDQFKQWAAEANELTQKLKEAEQSYGTFSRNVGNYSNGVADGIKKYTIEIGGATREFNSAKEAARELGNELLNLPKGAEGAQDLRKALQQVRSDIKDLSASSIVMDNLLDTMQSFTALASVGEGISALFGIDNSEIEQTIQKLVALQNVMQGLEQLNQQMNTGEGLMGWLSKGNDMIDSFVSKLTGASKAQKTLNEATTAGATASKGLAAAETAQAAATTTATVATKALSLALKTIGIGLIISAVATLITYWKDIYKWFTDTIPALKNLSTWFDNIRAIAVGVGSAIANYMIQPLATLVKTIQAIINGNFSEIPKIIGDGLKKTFNIAGNYQKGYHKEIERQQEKHNQKVKEAQKKANEEQLKDEEAKYGKSHQRTQEYYRKQMALVKEGSDEYRELQRKLWEDERQEREENERKRIKGSKVTTERIDLAKKAEEDLTNMTLEMMRDGLTKELAQLKINNKKKIEELKKNYASQKNTLKRLIDEQNKLYEQQRQDILTNYGVETTKLIDENTIKEVENEIEILNRTIEDKLKTRPAFIQPVSSSELKNIIQSYKIGADEMKKIYDVIDGLRKKSIAESKMEYDEYFDYLKEFMRANASNSEMGTFLDKWQDAISEGVIDKKKMKDTIEYAEGIWKEYYGNLYDLAMRYGNVFEAYQKDEATVLTNSLSARMAGEKAYMEEVNRIYEEHIKKRLEKEKQALAAEQKIRNESLVAEANKLGTEIKETNKKRESTKNEAEIKELDNQLLALQRRYEAVINEQSLLADEYANKIVEVERKTTDTLRELTEKGFRNFTSNLREYLTEMDKIADKQPTYNSLGFININATKKQFEEVKMAASASLGYIDLLRQDLEEKFKNGLITPEARAQIEKELNGLEISVNTRFESINEKLKELPLNLAKQINDVLQIIGQAATSVIQSIGDINQAAFEKQLEAVERQTEALEDQLDKQKELTQKYKDDVDSIEDELSTARGDRRQHLIDQLNAQMQAQRESLAQEKRMEKEREKLEKKREKLEYDNEMRKWNQSKLTAAINTALAISSAAVNSWPIPAVPMIAAATAMGAAQMAAIIANKPKKYAEGGLLQGRSHAQGGIPVGASGIEVEGNEYIINKHTTMQNVDVLDFVNSKKRKLTIDDFIDFYTKGSKVSRNVSSMRAKFEDGGQLPTIRTDIELNSRLIDTMERYSERAIQVEVVDIINKADDVRRVQTLAGLS